EQRWQETLRSSLKMETFLNACSVYVVYHQMHFGRRRTKEAARRKRWAHRHNFSREPFRNVHRIKSTDTPIHEKLEWPSYEKRIICLNYRCRARGNSLRRSRRKLART